MRRTTRLLKISLAVLFALGAARGAHAQNGNTQISESQGAPKVEIAFGYTYMRSDIVVTGSSFNMNGGSGSVAFNLKSWLRHRWRCRLPRAGQRCCQRTRREYHHLSSRTAHQLSAQASGSVRAGLAASATPAARSTLPRWE